MDAILRFFMPGLFGSHSDDAMFRFPLPDGRVMWCSDTGICGPPYNP